MEEEEKTNEKEKAEEVKPAGKPENSKDGDKPETTPIIERAREEREKLETANKKKEELLDREERIMAKRALGGETEAGQVPVKKTEDEKWAEDAKERYEGTGLDPTDDNTPTTYA